MTADLLLLRIVERLRALRVGRRVQVDDGWRADRDLSVAVGAWAWAHLRTLVEDHGSGRCLLRVRMDVRPRAGAVALVAGIVLEVLLAWTYGGGRVATAAAACTLLILLKVARDLSRDLGQILGVVAATADDYGMQPVDAVQSSGSKAASSRWRRIPATPGG